MLKPLSLPKSPNHKRNELDAAGFTLMIAIGRTDLTIQQTIEKFPSHPAVKAYLAVKERLKNE
jgi:hypothetical protein